MKGESEFMKKALSVVLALLLICSVMPMSVFAADDTVKTVSSAEELAAVANDLAGNYKLTSNIDLSKYNGGKWTPIASSGTFSGTFEGNGKKITGLNVSLTGTGTLYGGLFGNVSGTIKNLTVSGTVSVTVSGRLFCIRSMIRSRTCSLIS